MPRASRYLREGFIYHLTHRCHDRRFLLRFKHERDAYREWLRVGIKRYGVSVYGYCLTSNHTHVVAHVDDREATARVMQLAAGAVGRSLNRRKHHEGSVWEHPYQCTMIENGQHLLNCLRYVDLNMVRAGAVPHPSAWRWCAYDELTGQRKRYRLVHLSRLLEQLDLPDASSLARVYKAGIADQIERRDLFRQHHWTETLAVGSAAFVDATEKEYPERRTLDRYAVASRTDPDTWAVRETSTAYAGDSAQKSAL